MSQKAIGSAIPSRARPRARKLIRQPNQSISTVATGMMTSCPADMPPAAMPMASPRRRSNQRAAMTDPVASPRPPEPIPITMPVVRYACQSAWTAAAPIAPSPSSPTASSVTRRGPQRSARRPANGPTAPSRSSESAATPEIAPRLQPNSASIGLT